MAGAISWTNRVLSDTDGASVGTVSGSTAFTSLAFDSGYPAANCITADPSKVSRVNYQTGAGTFEAYVEAYWTTNYTVRAVAALNLRLPSTAVGVRFEVLTAASASQETTTQVVMASLVLIPGTTDRYNAYAILSADRSVARLRFRVGLAASGTDYFEVGHLWAGPALRFSDGFSRDWRLGVVDGSKVVRSNGGGYAAYRYNTRATLEISKTALAYADAIGNSASPSALNLRQFAREAGIGAPVLAIMRDTNSHTLQTLSIYGLVESMPEISHLGGDYYGAGIKISEIR